MLAVQEDPEGGDLFGPCSAETPRWVDWLKVIVGIVFLAFGVLWTLQGLNLLQGSFMSGQTMWLVIGIVLALLGVWLLWSLRAGRGKVGVR